MPVYHRGTHRNFDELIVFSSVKLIILKDITKWTDKVLPSGEFPSVIAKQLLSRFV